MKDSGTGCNDVKGAVTVVYSPSSCCFKTTVALAYCRQQSAHKKVLFISFEEFAGLDSFLKGRKKIYRKHYIITYPKETIRYPK